MGNSSSTRKITVPNDDPASVIKVSDAVVQRMKGGLEGGDGDVRNSYNKKVEKLPIPVQPQPASAGEPSLTSLEIRQEKEAELRSNDRYWEQRLSKLQDSHMRINRRLEDEYDTAVLEVQRSYESPAVVTSEPPCQDAKEVVLQCYRDNPKQALLCAKQVKEFQACVDVKRMDMIDNKA